jgi:ketosteroid isomerase-like protein
VRSTQQIARRYFDAWTSGDRDTVTTLLAPDFAFSAGDLKAFAGAGAGTEGRQGGGRR